MAWYRRPTLSSALLWLSLAWSWTLLAIYPHPPATDWPEHTAVAGILAALWQGDPCVSAHYAFNWQWTPYHLLYGVLAPAIALLGQRWGGTAVLMAMAGLTHLALRRWADILGRPRFIAAYSPLIFFGVNFAWGFGPSMMGMPWLLLAMAEMTRLWQRPHWAQATLAGLYGALAVASHAVFLPCCALMALPFMVQRSRAAWGTAAWAGLLASVPAWPMLALGLWHGGGTLPEMRFENAFDAWNHLRMGFARFDRGLCRAAHQGFTLVALAGLIVRRQRLTGQERYVLCLGAMATAALMAVPISIETKPIGAWLMNARYLSVADAAVVLVAMPRLSSALRSRLRTPELVLAAAVFVFMVGLTQIFAQLHVAAQPIDKLAHSLHKDTLWGETRHPPHFSVAWPPLTRHLLRSLSPTPVCYAQDIFVGSHLPIRAVARPEHLDALPPWP